MAEKANAAPKGGAAKRDLLAGEINSNITPRRLEKQAGNRLRPRHSEYHPC